MTAYALSALALLHAVDAVAMRRDRRGPGRLVAGAESRCRQRSHPHAANQVRSIWLDP